jgi:hypothetical protein
MSYNDYPPFKYATQTATGWTSTNSSNNLLIKGSSISSTPGVLHGVLVGTGTASTLTFYDNNTSTGTILMVLNATTPGFYGPLDVAFTTGLTVTSSISGGTATVLYF